MLLCISHIADEALAGSLGAQMTERACSFCSRTASEDEDAFAVALGDLVEKVDHAIDSHYVSVERNRDGVWLDTTGTFAGMEPLACVDVVNEICEEAFEGNVTDEVLEAIARAIMAGPDLMRVSDSHDGWYSFSELVRSTSRFVMMPSQGGPDDWAAEPDGSFVLDSADEAPLAARRTPFDSIGPFLEQLRHYVDGGLDLIDALPAETAFHRGRLMDSAWKLKPEAESLRPAPSEKATANRMSPAGISMFYASADAQTAIAEIASHGPEPYALMGAFRSTRELKVLDLTRWPRFPSYFDADRTVELKTAIFLRAFVKEITAPIIPDGRQHVEYVPTQVLTEYLRWVPNTAIDGIALPSAQSKDHAKTYVLFFNGEDCVSAAYHAGNQHSRATFTLDPKEIDVWKVERTYAGEKYQVPDAFRD